MNLDGKVGAVDLALIDGAGGCGIGPELALLLVPLAAAWRRRRR